MHTEWVFELKGNVLRGWIEMVLSTHATSFQQRCKRKRRSNRLLLWRFLPCERLWVVNNVGYSRVFSGVSLSIHILNLTLDNFN